MPDTVGSILQHKGHHVWSVSPGESVLQAIRLMADKGIGALLVIADEKLVGIISERDYALMGTFRADMTRMEEAERQRQEEEQQRLIQQRREEFVNSDRENAKKSVEAFSRPISRVEREFMQAVPQFRQAVTTYRDAIGAEGALKESVKGLDRFVDLFKEYFKVTHVDLPVIDKTEFSTFSKKDLVWETLTTAERIDADLRLAVKHLQEANSTNTLSIETVVFMRDLHGEVLRLEMLLSKVK